MTDVELLRALARMLVASGAVMPRTKTPPLAGGFTEFESDAETVERLVSAAQGSDSERGHPECHEGCEVCAEAELESAVREYAKSHPLPPAVRERVERVKATRDCGRGPRETGMERDIVSRVVGERVRELSRGRASAPRTANDRPSGSAPAAPTSGG